MSWHIEIRNESQSITSRFMNVDENDWAIMGEMFEKLRSSRWSEEVMESIDIANLFKQFVPFARELQVSVGFLL